ncbi:MAG: hypothetical protein ACLGID_12990 [Gammaproteobacteria bacterium]
MTNETRWKTNSSGPICYAVRLVHPLHRFVGFGPFPSATEAGNVLDKLLERYPEAEATLDRARSEELPDWSSAALDDRYEKTLLDVALGNILPFSVIQIIGRENQQITFERAQTFADQAGCPVGEIVTMRGIGDNGEEEWPVFRRHLETDDQRKAETQALWLLRGRSNNDTICIMAYPFEGPAENAER